MSFAGTGTRPVAFLLTAIAFIFGTVVGVSRVDAQVNPDRFFLEGIDDMGDGKFAEALGAFDQAIKSSPYAQIRVYHLNRAVALMMLQRGPEAAEALGRAGRILPLDADEDSRVWQYTWMLMFDGGKRPANAAAPPFVATAYADGLLTAAAGYKSARGDAERERFFGIIQQKAREYCGSQSTSGVPADQLDRAAYLDNTLINNTQDNPDPAIKAVNAVAWADHWEWIGENKKAVGAAVAGIEAQPWNLDALDYLIYLCPKVGVPELGQKYQDRKDSLVNPSANAQLRVFQKDLKSGNDAAAQADLDEARKIDPSSTALQLARLDLAVHRRRSGEIAAQARLIHGMEEGRLRMSGRTLDPQAAVPISMDDARISVIAYLIAGKIFDDAGDRRQMLDAYGRALPILHRVPLVEIIAPGKYPHPPLSSQPDLGPESRVVDLRGTAYEAHRRCAETLLALNDEAAAVAHCQTMIRLNQGSDAERATEQIGYRIYRKLGWASLGELIPASWQSDFPAWDAHPGR